MPAANSGVVFNIKGRWGTNTPLACPADQCMEAVNVDWFRSTLGRKRSGAVNVALTGGTAQTGVISFLFSHVPNFDQTVRELWSLDDAATPRWKRLTGGTAWANVTSKDAVATRPMDVNACSFNGKMFIGYDSTVNRLQVWDPTDAAIRRVGIDTPAAPTAANVGVGGYTNIRYFKVVYTTVVSGATIRRSEASPALTFTPSGTGLSATITKPATVSEGETHWLLYASNDDANYVLIATTVVGTATFSDTNLTGIYTGTAIPVAGSFTCPPSAKFLVCDDSRLVMAGNWETTTGNSMAPSPRRVWWTSPLGATDQGDDERVSNTSTIKSYTDVDAAVTGLSYPLQGAIYVFSYNSMWKMVGTGVYTAPYVRYRVTEGKGCIDHKTIVVAEDENGAPCMYWISPQGPCRTGAAGQFNLIEDISDLWDLVNLDATNVVGHAVYHRDKHQIWWYLAASGSNDPAKKLVFDCHLGRIVEAGKVRRGWSEHTGLSVLARCSTMHSDTLGASMSRALKPYIGRSTGTLIWKADSGVDDAGTNNVAYIKTRVLTPSGLGQKSGTVADATLMATAAAGVTVTLTVIKDMGVVNLPFPVLLTPEGVETNVIREVDSSACADAKCVQYQIGDTATTAAAWNLDALTVPTTDMGMN